MQNCIRCGDTAFIRCLRCSPAAVLCRACDEQLHEIFPLHDRQVWSGSHFEAIPPTITIDDSMQAVTIRKGHATLICNYMHVYNTHVSTYIHIYSVHVQFTKHKEIKI